jgi:plasmid segregation protein ParM
MIMSNSLGFFGIDDGHSSIKGVNGNEFNMPSKVSSGAIKGLNVVTGENDNCIYAINNQSYTISPNVENTLDTRFEDYPTSNINIVLVYHALKEMKAEGNIAICTGLPFNRYYKEAIVNKILIDSKIQAFQSEVNTNNDGFNFNIKEHLVCSEGVASYFDLMLNKDGTEDLEFKDYLGEESAIIVDIGGRTTDIVTLKSDNIVFDYSTTIDTGCLSVEDILYKKVSNRLGTYDIPKTIISKIINNGGIYKASKVVHDFSKELEDSKKQLAETIVNKLKQMISNTLEIGLIAFVGGGSLLLKKELEELYPAEYVKFVANPMFSNARGMKKLLKRSFVDE